MSGPTATAASDRVGARLRAHRAGPAVVAIGTFDRVHAGHRAVMATTARVARERGARAVALTFTPRPDLLAAPARSLPDLCGLDERVRRLRAAGADDVVVVDFDPDVRAMGATEFVRHLVEDLGTVAICVGEDFALGRGRQGTIDALRALGLEVITIGLLVDARTGRKFASRDLRAASAPARAA